MKHTSASWHDTEVSSDHRRRVAQKTAADQPGPVKQKAWRSGKLVARPHASALWLGVVPEKYCSSRASTVPQASQPKALKKVAGPSHYRPRQSARRACACRAGWLLPALL